MLFRSAAATRFCIIGEATSLKAAVAECERLAPDLVLLELRLPDGSGAEAVRQILASRPATRLLFLTSFVDEGLLREVMNCGAHGCLLKDIDAAGLTRALVDVAAGKFVLDPAMNSHVFKLVRQAARPAQPARDRLAHLSRQERRVLALVAGGKTNKEIGDQMELSAQTVKNYLSNVFEKLQINRRAQAAVLYTESRSQG